jgi:D-sedoheptulose 7-phosphate isomerase
MITNHNIIHSNNAEYIQTIELVLGSRAEPIAQSGEVLVQSLAKGGMVFWCGNGGSAADSQHLAAELVGRFKKNRSALRSIALSTDTSVLTCVANDFGFDDIFSRQEKALGHPSNVLIGISTSGKSENVMRALSTAKLMELTTVALLGKGGGATRNMVDYALVVPSDTIARIQEAHIFIGHILCEIIEQGLDLA